MASRNISTTYIIQTPQTFQPSATPPVAEAAVTVTTTYLETDISAPQVN